MNELAQNTRDFWTWFVDHEPSLRKSVDSRDFRWLQQRFAPMLMQLHSGQPPLAWELGPGGSAEYQLVISPVIRDNLEAVDYIVRESPKLNRWEVHACRQPKPGEYKYLLTFPLLADTDPAINASDWKFAVKRRKSDPLLDVLFVAEFLDGQLAENVWRTRLAYLLLDNVLGERVTLNTIGVAYVALPNEIPATLPLAPIASLGGILPSTV